MSPFPGVFPATSNWLTRTSPRYVMNSAVMFLSEVPIDPILFHFTDLGFSFPNAHLFPKVIPRPLPHCPSAVNTNHLSLLHK